jgi:hypothetical protein
MPLIAWIVLYIVFAGPSLWIAWGRNAEVFSGSGFLVPLLRDFWAADSSPGWLRTGGWLAFIGSTIIFAYGVFNPDARSFWDLF